jgi:hypothetical protein
MLSNSLGAQNVNLFPNPTSSIVNIETKFLAGTKYTIEVQSLLGETIFSFETKSIENNSLQIDFSAYANGIYILNIKQENRSVSVKRIMVNK